jgi:hypothetical protein
MDFSNTQKRILIYSFVIFLATKLLEQAYTSIDISVATNSELFISSLIRTFNHFSLAVGLSCMLLLGIQTIRKSGFSIKSILMPSIGFVLILFFIYLSSSKYRVLERTSQFIKSKPHYEELLSTMESSLERQDLPTDSKAFLSKYYARTKYEQAGLIIDHFTPEGIVTIYKPTAKEVTQRNEMLKSEVEAIFWSQLAKRTIWGSLIFWTLLTIVSILIGIFSPIDGIKSHH